MKDRKGVEILKGDTIWIGRRRGNYGELVAREVVEAGDTHLFVQGIEKYLDKRWAATVTRRTRYDGNGSCCLVDLSERRP